MKSFDEFKSERIFTVGELIEKLKLLNPNTKVGSDGPDCGGYDICTMEYCVIEYDAKCDTIYFSHNECEAFSAVNKTITYEQYREIICESDIEN